jgi:GDP-4-dehydro-6-deoxy-D-mannose reductase
MLSVLITGVNGFVGRHLARELSEHGYNVIGIGGQTTDKATEENIDDYRVLDLTDPQSAQSINFCSIDWVIHLAGLAAVGPSFDKPMNYISTNMGIEINLFEAALAQKANPKFIVISSGSLYDPGATLPLTEHSVLLANSPYAVSKLGQEQLAAYYATRGFECIIARPFNHIGPGQGLGFIVPDLTKQVIEAEKGTQKEVMVGNLDAERDYTDVRDIVNAYRLLLEKGHPGETYNVCSGTPHSGHEILRGILKATGIQPEITVDPSRMRPSDSPKIYGSHKKLTAHTDWEPKISIETTLRDVAKYWRHQLQVH